MDNTTSVPPEPAPQPPQLPSSISPAPSPAPPAHLNAAPKAVKTGSGIAKLIIVSLVTAVVVGAAAFYAGWKIGSNANSGGCGQSPGGLAYPCGGGNGVYKPVVYLYPTKTEQVSVQVTYPAGFSYTYPTYNLASGWQVLATPSGTMTNLADNKQYPYLIWEGNPAPIKWDMSTGFVVPGDQTNEFLHQELPIIGLSPAETDAFIAYWQPKMVGNKYNLIHFAGKEYTDYAKLTVSPKPDSELRVLMAFEPLKKPAQVTPQTFSGFKRAGFTVVEWGGTEL